MQIYIDDEMMGAEVKRSFWEQFFSWPWKPWQKIKFDPNAGGPRFPDGIVGRWAGKNKLVMNSRTWNELKNHIQNS
jgi:hypothetical protein